MNIPDFKVLLKIFGNKANGPAVLDANGDLVGNIIPRTGLLADLQALAGTPGEIAYATDFPAIVTFNGVAGQAKTTFPTATGLRAAVIPTIPGFIGSNTTVTIGTGKNFADMEAYKAFIEQCVVDENATVTLRFDRGSFVGTFPSTGKTWPHTAFECDPNNGGGTITGVSISATGAAGAWTITLSKTGLADTLLGVGGANDASRLIAITDGTAGTNPDNAVGVYQGITRVGTSADSVTLSGLSTLTAMPSGGALCTIFAPATTLDSIIAGDPFGNIRSIKLGSTGGNQPVAVVNLGQCKNQKIKGAASGTALLNFDIGTNPNEFDFSTIYTQFFTPTNCRFPQSLSLITDSFYPTGCTSMFVNGFIIDQGAGTTINAVDDTSVSFSDVTVINTLADGQLEAYNGGVLAVGTLTINGTAVTAANLANYTSLTPGFMSDDGGLIYFAGNNKLTNPYSNATASRALNTNYTNSGKRSLLVTVSARCVVTVAAGSATIQGFSDTAATPTTAAGPLVGVQSGLLNEDNTFSTTFVVAPGTNYRVNSAVSNGTATLGTWWELTL